MTLSDCYRILEIPQGVPWAEVKRAYRKLAKRHHPDRREGDASGARFKEISAAFEILEFHYEKNKGEAPPPEPPSSFLPVIFAEPEGVRQEESQVPAQVSPGGEEPIPHEKSPRIDWKKVLHDTALYLERMWLPLDRYQGVTLDRKMADKGGNLRVSTPREIFDVKIPPGVRHGMQLKLAGKGGKSLFCDYRGDLYLKVRLTPESVSKPGATNLYYEMEIRRDHLGKGRVFTLHTVQGPIKFFPPGNTSDGQTFILKARPDDPVSRGLNHILQVRLV